MKDNHITDILDNVPFVNLSEDELQTIRAHVATCVECEQAFAAAQLSALLLQERTSEAAENALKANPFFQTRVLAAWREQQSLGSWSFRRLWNSTGAIVASMAAMSSEIVVCSSGPSPGATSSNTGLADISVVTISDSSSLVIASSSIRCRICGVNTSRC